MGSDAIGNRFAVDSEITASGIGVDHGAAPVGKDFLPLQLGEFLLALGADEARFDPVGPVAAEAIAAIGDNEIQLLGASNISFDLRRVPGRSSSDDLR